MSTVGHPWPSRIIILSRCIPTTDIIDIAISIVVQTIARNLMGINPNIIADIGVKVFNPIIHDSNDDPLSLGQIPSRLHIEFIGF